MSTQPRRLYTLEEYFALELASEERYEYFDGEIFNMSGASPQRFFRTFGASKPAKCLSP